MKTKLLAKDIKESLKYHPAYFNSAGKRSRVYDVKTTRDGKLFVKIIANRPAEMGHGNITWQAVGFSDSISIYPCTAMEEVLTLAI